MATTRKRLVIDGRPSIPTALDLPATRAAVDQIRTRLEKLDAAVNLAFSTIDGSSPQSDLEALQRQIAVLSKALEKLTAQVAAATGARQPTYLAMQMGDDGEDGLTGPPGPPGPTGPPGPMAAQGCYDCGGDEYTIVLQQITSGTSTPGGDSFLWDEEGRVLLTEDGEAIILG